MTDDPDRLLQILRETCLSEIRSDQPDLKLRQLAVALVVYQTNEMQNASGLAEHLNISKSAVSRALNRLEELKLAHRTMDGRNRRSVLVQRTAGVVRPDDETAGCAVQAAKGMLAGRH